MSEEQEFDLENEIAYWRNEAVRELQFAGRLIGYKDEEVLYCFSIFIRR
jgi:hypothetical protein